MTRITSGTAFIWISRWEYQCCGAPIAAGDVVNLTVFECGGAESWEAVLDAPIPLVATHHLPPEDSYPVRVRVERLLEARARREQREEGLCVMPGSEVVADISVMSVGEQDWQPDSDGETLQGWILQGAFLQELPPG